MAKTSPKITLAALLSIVFIDSLSYFIIIPVLLRLISPSSELFSAEVGEATRNILFGFTIGLLQLAYLIFAPLVGRCSDYLGRKKVLSGCLIIAAISFVISIWGITVHNLWLILLGRFLGGIGASSQPIAWAAIADISAQTQKALYLSLAAFAMTLALVVGPLLGAYLSDTAIGGFNNQFPFMVAIGLIIINLLLLKFGLQETKQQATPQRTGYLQASLRVCFNLKVFLLLMVLFSYEFAWSLYFQDIALYLKQVYDYTPEQSAQLTTWAGLCMLLGLGLIYPLALKYFSLNAIMLSCLLVVALSLLGCASIQPVWAQWAMAMPLAIAVGIIYPSLLASMSDELPQEDQGLVMGLAATMLALAWTSSAFLTGVLTNIFASLPLLVAAIAAILAAVVFISTAFFTASSKPASYRQPTN